MRNDTVHDMFKIDGATFCVFLLVVHALTGCDLTTSFTSVGKKTAFKMLQTKIIEFQSLYDLRDLVEF